MLAQFAVRASKHTSLNAKCGTPESSIGVDKLPGPNTAADSKIATPGYSDAPAISCQETTIRRT